MKRVLVFLIFLICLAVTLGAFLLFKTYERQESDQILLSEAKRQIQDIKQEFEDSLTVLVSLRAFYDSSTFVDRDEFKTFTKSLLESHPDIKGLEWAPVVLKDERADIENKVRSEGFPDFTFTERNEKRDIITAKERESYVPVIYLEPLKGNQRAFGFDLASNEARRKSLEQAKKVQDTVATEPIELVQASGIKKGVLLISPVYKKPSKNVKHLYGYIAAVLMVEDVIAHALEGNELVFKTKITDISNQNKIGHVFSNFNSDDTIPLYFEYSEILNFAGRTWQVNFFSEEQMLTDTNILRPFHILIFGLLFSALITSFMNNMLAQNKFFKKAFEDKAADHKKAEGVIEEHLAFQNIIMENIPDLLFVKDKDFKIIKANPAFLNVYPKEMRDNIIGTTTIENYDKEEAKEFLKHDKKAFEEGFSGTEETLVFPDGKIRTLYTTKTRFKDPNDQEYILGIGRDITNIKVIQNDLEKRTDSLEMAERTARLGHWQYDLKTEEIEWSDEIYNIHGVEKDSFDLDLESALSFYHPNDKKFVQESLQNSIDKKKPFEFELRLIRKSGETIYVYSKGRPELNVSGAVTALFGVFQDITDTVEAQKKLKESEEQFRTAMENSAIGMALVSLDGRWLSVNKALCNILGYSSEELLRIDFQQITHADDLDKDLEFVDQVSSGEIQTYQMEKRYLHKDGSVIWAILSVSLVRSPDGTPKHFISQIQDITERKMAEEEILRSNEELERFAYIASHDLQEPLRMVYNFTNLLSEEYSDKLDDQARQYIKFSLDASIRMQDLVSDLLEYSRIGEQNTGFSEFNANQQIKSVLENLKEEIEETSAQITIEDLPSVFASPVRFNRLVQNLIGNAIKYSPADRTPEINVGIKDDGHQWIFSIKDNGIGIKEEYLEQIFVIFKRLHNKNEYSGTGIGLAICRKIVESFGGQLWAESEYGKGSAFFFSMPKHKKTDEE